ncbi:hypothetical protein ABTZ78_03555 [Streptomyces bauhiniae]|uniref:hypothetical protein n=1 Tax=Streptomyces bauhiniae TaxID=2340725 RepID=UPI0033286FA2
MAAALVAGAVALWPSAGSGGDAKRAAAVQQVPDETAPVSSEGELVSKGVQGVYLPSADPPVLVVGRNRVYVMSKESDGNSRTDTEKPYLFFHLPEDDEGALSDPGLKH